jgi:5'-methylthioadenosine phosphorylase
LINMTGHPEAVLARELGMCYAAIALVTDFDAGVEETDDAVTQEEVFRVFGQNVARLRDLLEAVVPELPNDRTCACSRALDGIELPAH